MGHDSESSGWRGGSRLALRLLATLALAGMLPAAAAAQQDQQAPKDSGLFATDAPLEITLRGPWRELVRRKGDQSRHPATLEYVDAAGQTHTLALTVARRGISRQKVCDFPPIMLRFARGSAKGSAFRGQRSLKMVTHCGKGEVWEQYYVKEMLAYRMYNLVTERSFRVRPLTVTYVDSRSSTRDGPHFAFLIEDAGAVAKRNGMEELNLSRLEPEQLDSLHSSRFALFQYLIGNTDYAVLTGASGGACCHNSVLIGSDAGSGIHTLPYDFDGSGLVDAAYAVTHPSLPIGSVTQRLFRGFCVHSATVEPVRLEFLAREREIRDLVGNESRLKPRNRALALRYVGGFFDVLRNPDQFADKVTAKCRR